MALFDAMLELSDDQDVSQAAGTVASTNILDFTLADLEMGAGQPLWLNIKVGTEPVANTDGDATIAVALCYDTVAPVDSSSSVIYSTPALAEAALTAGAWVLRMPIPVNIDEEKIVGLLYTVGGSSASTTGTIDAWLDNGSQSSYDTQVAESNI